jgi:hypothetical protein
MSIYDNAGVVLIPSGYKAASTDNLYSVLPANGDGDFNATRGSTATRVNKDGFIESVATNVPRLNYPLIDGVVQDCPALLLEPSRTNDMQRTEEFSNSYWTKYNSSVTANQVVSPDGAVTADRLIENTVNTQHETGRSFSFTSGTTYAVSVFAKTNGRNLMIRAGNTATWQANATFNLEIGEVQSVSLGSAYIENYGNGWYRCTVVGQAAASSSTNINFRLVKGTISTYAGDNSSGVYLWGAQREIGSYQTSYISWDGSGSTTRSADVCNGSGTSADINSVEGVLFAEIAALANDQSSRRITIAQSISNLIRLGYDSVSNRIFGVVYNGTNQAILLTTSYTITDFHKIAVKYKENDFALWVNGVEVAIDLSGSTFATGTLNEFAFDDGGGGNLFYGKVKQAMNFKTALNDSELETITSWDSFNSMATGQLYTIE